NSAASIANTCLPKGVPRAQTNRRPLTWPALSLSLNSRMEHCLCPNACFVGLGTSPTGVILGSQGFVESHFLRLKQRLGYRRHKAATRLTALGSPGLWVFRDLGGRPVA